MKGFCFVFAMFLVYVASSYALPPFDVTDIEVNPDSETLLRPRRAVPCTSKSCDTWCRRMEYPGGECTSTSVPAIG